MLEFTDFPLRGEEKTQQIVRDVIAICNHIAKTNRGAHCDSAYVVQHSDKELMALFEIVSRAHDKSLVDGSILQCGMFCGGSAIMMAHALRDDTSVIEPMIAIDSYTKDYAPLRELFDNAYFEFRQNVWEFRLHDYIATIISDSVTFLKHFWERPLRLAFIDSSHHYEPTLNELSLIVPKIAPGGWLLLHDYFATEPPATGVAKAANEVFASQNLQEWTFYKLDQLAIAQRATTNNTAVHLNLHKLHH